jgi:transcriptional regulator with XRE-family HTH domain
MDWEKTEELMKEINRYRKPGESNRKYAKRLGVSDKWLGDVRRGRIPGVETLSKVCDALGLPPEEFYHWVALLTDSAEELSPRLRSGEEVDKRVRAIPLLLGDTSISIEQGAVGLSSDAQSVIPLPEALIETTKAGEDIVAVQLPLRYRSAEPEVARGSTILIDTEDHKLIEGNLYATSSARDAARISVRRAIYAEDESGELVLEQIVTGRTMAPGSHIILGHIVAAWKVL